MKLVNLEATRKAFAPFETIEQLNANTIAIRANFAEVMTTSEKAVLDVIHRYSSKHFGVCYLAKETIAEMVNLSRRQVIRICKKLESLGMFVQYATDRKQGGGQTSNTIVFLTQINAKSAFIDAEVTPVVSANVTDLDALKETPKDSLKDNKTKEYTKDTEKREELSKKGLVTKIPKTLKNALAPFFDSSELYEMTGVIYKAKASIDKDVMIEDNEEVFYEAILSVMNAYRRGKVKSVQAVLYKAVQNVTSAIVNERRNDARMSMYGL